MQQRVYISKRKPEPKFIPAGHQRRYNQKEIEHKQELEKDNWDRYDSLYRSLQEEYRNGNITLEELIIQTEEIRNFADYMLENQRSFELNDPEKNIEER